MFVMLGQAEQLLACLLSTPKAGSRRRPGSWRGLCSFDTHVLFSDEKLRLTVAFYAAPVEQGALGLLLCPRLGLLIPAAQGGGPWLPL